MISGAPGMRHLAVITLKVIVDHHLPVGIADIGMAKFSAIAVRHIVQNVRASVENLAFKSGRKVA